MIISIIVAIGRNWQIGLNNQLIWKLSDDLKNFKSITLNHSIIMGRKTFESIGRPLPKRTNIIITRNKDYKVEGCYIFSSLESAFEFCKNNNEEEVIVCGGGEIYKQALEYGVDKIYLTKVDYDGAADVFFPELNYKEWKITDVTRHEKDENNEYSWEFSIFEKK